MLLRAAAPLRAVSRARARTAAALRPAAPAAAAAAAPVRLQGWGTRCFGTEHDDFAPVSKAVPESDIQDQIDEARAPPRSPPPTPHPSLRHAVPHPLHSAPQAVKGSQVVLFMKGVPAQPRCGFSNMVVKILEMEGVEDYSAYDVLSDEELREGIKIYSDWPTIPQLYIDGEFMGGCDIVRGMYEDGSLTEALANYKADE